MSQADIAVVGLAVMGENLILNMESKGFTVACFNRTVSKVDDFMKGRAQGKNIIGCHSVEEMVASLKTPRKVMVMVKATAVKGRVATATASAPRIFLMTRSLFVASSRRRQCRRLMSARARCQRPRRSTWPSTEF